MIQPISLREYMDKIARKFENLPEGKEKEELGEEIKKIAERSEPTITIERIDNNEHSE